MSLQASRVGPDPPAGADGAVGLELNDRNNLSAPSVILVPMCGRYALKASDDELSGLYGAFVVGEESRPSWNVAPTQEVRVVLEHLPSDDPDPVLERQIRSVRWGLVPGWSKEPKLGRLINARAETVTREAQLPSRGREAPLRAPSRRVLRVAGHPGREATVLPAR